MKIYQEDKSKQKSYSVYLKILGVAVCILTLLPSLFSQNDSASQRPVFDSAKVHYDSAANELFRYVKRFGDSEQRRKLTEYSEDTIATRQETIIGLIRKLTLEAQAYLESGLDTGGLSNEINKIEYWYEVTGDGVFTNTGTIQTHRNLETSFKIMRELRSRMVARKSSLDLYYQNLVRLRNTIDSLYKDSVLYKFSSDSVVLMRYVQKLHVVALEIRPIDSAFKKTLSTVSELQPVVNRLVNKLNEAIAQIDIFQKELSSQTFNRETSDLAGPVKFVRSISEIIDFSLIKGMLSLVFYIQNEKGKLFWMLLLVIASTLLVAGLKNKLRRINEDPLPSSLPVFKYPVLSSITAVLTLYQFVFVDPPFIFTALIWVTSALALTIILKSVINRNRFMVWLTLLLFFLLACFDNLILQASRQERWMMLVVSVAGILGCSAMMLMLRKRGIGEKLLIWSIGFVVVLQLVSIITNGYGRYNLSKTCLTAGFFNVALAVLFYWTMKFINQTLSVAARLYNTPNKKLFRINFDATGGNSPTAIYVLLIIGWFVLFARNFYAYKLIAVPLKNFVTLKRTVGDFSFSISNVLEFFLVLYLSGVLSRLVSFFASGNTSAHGSVTQKGVGSWTLIVRIAIMSIGLLIALGTIGIPMDRLTIILSALSVGVGFGLQTLVNNLVSGLIISFEKPVQVGDIIDIGGQSGTVKSIGFRSSIITTIAGADVVIPNGDLLSQHLVNWTHENTYRCVDIPVSVAHGTDLQKAIKILNTLPAGDDRILTTPAPTVMVKQFGAGSIDMQLSFWVRNIRQWTAVRTDMMLAIDRSFRQNGIHIPLPQQELHLRSFSKEESLAKDTIMEKG
ncbi:MAG: mechanosensitive ion channel family protein [Bacteroidia bacterium]